MTDNYTSKSKEENEMTGMEEKRGVLGKIIAALSLGALIGGISGVLFAPKAGKETREDLARRATEAEETLKEKVDELKEKAAELQKKAAEVKKNATNQAAHLQEEITDISGKVKDGMDKAVDRMKDTVAKGKDILAEKRTGLGMKTAEEVKEGMSAEDTKDNASSAEEADDS
jgi:gas vesicle protein